jgi:pilus assembly protein Flp/PilA
MRVCRSVRGRSASRDTVIRQASTVLIEGSSRRGPSGQLARDHGATAAEYALMVSLIALVIFGAVLTFGQKVEQLFSIPPGYL